MEGQISVPGEEMSDGTDDECGFQNAPPVVLTGRETQQENQRRCSESRRQSLTRMWSGASSQLKAHPDERTQ